MEAFIAFVLAVSVASFIAWPLLTQQQSLAAVQGGRDFGPGRWERQKIEAYAAIKEAEFDHQMGKLTDTDFATLAGKYREQALAAIAAIETQTADKPRAAAAQRPSRIAYCPGCGQRVSHAAKFCAGCGINLLAAGK
ncbi:MAG TPA: hypothetical protein VMW17_08720 [Candidatus Binatia bacterium]|nr:hypothetical protein [Candidatus Binatia bacterium]